MALRRQRQSRSGDRTRQALARAGIVTGQRRPGEPALRPGEREAGHACKSLPEPSVRSGRPGSEGSNMSKSPSGRKRATQASPPTGKSDTPPAPAPRETEPQRVEPKSPSGRKRATQASPPTGKSEPPPAPARAKPSRGGSRRVAFRRPSARGERTGVPPPSRSRSTPTTSGWRGASPSAPTGTTGSKPSGNSWPRPEGTGGTSLLPPGRAAEGRGPGSDPPRGSGLGSLGGAVARRAGSANHWTRNVR